MRIFDILLAKKLAGGGGGGTMPDEYCIGGSLYNKTLVKYHFPTESVGNNLRDYYFSGCQQLEAIENFPTTATSIPYNFAYNCKNFDISSLPDGITSIAQNAFYSCGKLSLSQLPTGLVTIGNSGFYYCSMLRLTNLPSTLTSIGANAFQYCSNIKITQIPSGVTKIQAVSFNGCSSIESLAFAGDITEIGQRSFENCSACMVYDFRNNTGVPTLANSNVFIGINSNAKIVVPDALVDSWKAAARWDTYASYIIGVTDFESL